MLAGPNGSGKSTMKEFLKPEWLGVYLNPDEIEQSLRLSGFLDLPAYGVTAGADDVLAFFREHPLVLRAGLADAVRSLNFADGGIVFSAVQVNAYLASVAADLLRHKLLAQRVSFTFETVMSSPDKVAFLRKARVAGYRAYLYYVATEDPEINVARVHARVKKGGHSVPEDKIASRYHRSLDLLVDAIKVTDRAYVFDNSSTDTDPQWIAEVTNGVDLEVKVDPMPAWFHRAVWERLHVAGSASRVSGSV